MKTYTKFLVIEFLKSFLNIFLIMLSLVFILNILKEIEFFNNVNVSPFFPLYVSTLSTPSIIFEMFPFIFLVSTQFFFIKLFNNNEIEILKYSGLKNIKLLQIICFVGIILGFLIISVFYNTSSSLQNYYLQVKNKFSEDKVYLAVINKDGLWIKEEIDQNLYFIHAKKFDKNILKSITITETDKYYNLKNTNITVKEFDNFGHFDIIDSPWSDILHNTVSSGNKDRNNFKIQNHQQLMARIVSGFAKKKKNKITNIVIRN